MAVVCLHGPLRKLAGGESELPLDGGTVCELLRALEHKHAPLNGWILDERGILRPHINVYVNGELGSLETPTEDRDRIEVLPAISGG